MQVRGTGCLARALTSVARRLHGLKAISSDYTREFAGVVQSILRTLEAPTLDKLGVELNQGRKEVKAGRRVKGNATGGGGVDMMRTAMERVVESCCECGIPCTRKLVADIINASCSTPVVPSLDEE